MSLEGVVRQLGISDGTYYKCRKEYGAFESIGPNGAKSYT